MNLTEQELRYIRQLLGQQPHDQVNALIVKIEQMILAMAEKK